MNLRIKRFYEIYDKLPQDENICLTNLGLLKHVKLYNKIGSGLFGDVYTGYAIKTKTSQNPLKLRIKKTPDDVDFIIKVMYDSKSHRDEANFSEVVSKFVYEKLCPHFPLSYGYYLCKNARFSGYRKLGVFKEAGDWSKKIKIGKGIVLAQEYTGIGFEKFLDLKPTHNELITAILQVIIGLYCLYKHGGVYHNDLYFSNITMKKVTHPIYYKYKINNKTYHCVATKMIPILIDFGQISNVDKNEIPDDIFLFFSDFSVDDTGKRPSISDTNEIKLNIDLDIKSERFITNILKKMINIHAINCQSKLIYDKTHMNPLYILERYFYNKFKKPLQNPNYTQENYTL